MTWFNSITSVVISSVLLLNTENVVLKWCRNLESPNQFAFALDMGERNENAREETYTEIKVDESNKFLYEEDPKYAAREAMKKIGYSVEERLVKLFEKTKSAECRALISEHMGYFLGSLGKEEEMPFETSFFVDECEEEKYDFDDLPKGMSIGKIQNRTYQPPPSESFYIEDSADLKLLYGILTHEKPESTIRLIEALYHEGNEFVIHVDAKESSHLTYERLVEYSKLKPRVHVAPPKYRVRVNWGGFSMVWATLNLMKYALAIEEPASAPLEFHKFVHIASTSYPIASNLEIRRKISSYPLDANLMNVVFKPTEPNGMSWHYFVECDDAVHRIFRLPPLNEFKHGIDLYTASQWFIISREFAHYLALAAPGSFVKKYIEYAEHTVVADETFFGTVLRHTPFCDRHHNDNFLHVQFDRWENEIDFFGKRDVKKCLMPNPDHCGRSPTTMSMDYLPILELSNALFARKFDDDFDKEIKDVIDVKRALSEKRLRMQETGKDMEHDQIFDTSFEGHGALIVAKDTLYDDVPLCLGLGNKKNKVRLTPCFLEGVRETLSPEYETGAVLIEETMIHNRWEIGPCSTDGSLKRMPNGEMIMTPGNSVSTGPRCNFKQMDGVRAGRCMDAESERLQPGGEIQVFPCVGRWHQIFSFGNGNPAKKASIHTNVPLHVRNTIKSKERHQPIYMCIGVLGRGDKDEDDWEEDSWSEEEEEDSNEEETAKFTVHQRKLSDSTNLELTPLSEWNGKQLITTRCDNLDAVIEWVYIPFVHKDDAIYEIPNSSDENQL